VTSFLLLEMLEPCGREHRQRCGDDAVRSLVLIDLKGMKKMLLHLIGHGIQTLVSNAASMLELVPRATLMLSHSTSSKLQGSGTRRLWHTTWADGLACDARRARFGPRHNTLYAPSLNLPLFMTKFLNISAIDVLPMPAAPWSTT
jgi:hypothetical protein